MVLLGTNTHACTRLERGEHLYILYSGWVPCPSGLGGRLVWGAEDEEIGILD